jgi:hypothetical protein
MGRPSKGPRLYLRRDGDKKIWIIRDNGHDVRTGCAEHEQPSAIRALAEYRRGQPIPIKNDAAPGLIYFVTCMQSPNYPIKIGFTAGISFRLEKLQNGNPNLLTVLATYPGTFNDERTLHSYFQHLRVRGEWFRRGDDLLEYIVTLPGYSDAYGADQFEELDICARALNQHNSASDTVNETGR